MRTALLVGTAIFFALIASRAGATPPVFVPPPTSTQSGQPGTPSSSPSNFQQGILRRSNLLGDMWGLRRQLSKYGITLNVTETSEVLGNLTGGVKRGFEYDGLTVLDVQQDTQHAWGHYGGTINASALQIHGNNLSADNLASLQTSSGIEADRATRLWELWYQQKVPGEDLDFKMGQQSLDQEFMVSQNAGMFVNTMFGWAMVPSADLPGGGPAYPLSALGVRARYRPSDSLTLLSGVYSGSPTPNNNGDPQQQNPSGTSFPVNNGVLAISELQYSYPGLGAMVYFGQPQKLPRVYKIGAYYDTEKFADLRYDNNGLSLADLKNDGMPGLHDGDYGVYGVLDQMVWLSPEDPDRNWNFFTRVMAQPQEDRNLIDLSMNAGFVLHDPFPHLQRDDDNFGIGMGYAKVSSGAAGLQSATDYFTGSTVPPRSSETFFELTYQYQYTPWCQIQPDVQYVLNPGAGVPNPSAPGQQVHNELVIGMRVNLLF